jgi:hypothetical protein
MANEIYTLHNDGELYRGTVGQDWRARKKTYAFLSKGTAEREAKSRAKHEKGEFEVVRYLPTEEEAPKDDGHCDWQINNYKQPMALRWYLLFNRMPASDKGLMRENGTPEPELYAKYEGEWVRVVMASRFGDVGITKKLDRDYGYDEGRVSVADLSEFTDKRPA